MLRNHTHEATGYRSTKVISDKLKGNPKIGQIVELLIPTLSSRKCKHKYIKREILDIMKGPDYIRIITKV